MNRARLLLAALCLAAAGSATSAGDPARGEELHRICLQCHDTAPYLAPRAKIKSLAALRKEVARWGDYYNPRLSRQDVEDLVAWLNREFYKFPER